MKPMMLMATAALLATAATGALAQENYFEGKTIRVIVGLSPGGTSDTFIRTFSDYWQHHIPGQPTIIVENMPGSSNMLATNYVYESVEPDGLTLVYGPWNPTGQVLGSPELRADYANMEFIGASSDIRVNYMRRDVPPGISTPADIAAAEPFNFGGSSPGGFSDLLGRMSLDLLGVEHNYVTGYQGGNDVYAAVLANEIQMGNTSYGTLVTRQADFIAEGGEGIAVYYFCMRDASGEHVRLDLELDVPCFVDLYQEIHGEPPSGEVWDTLDWLVNLSGKVTFLALAPPGTPEEAVRDLREGFYRAAADEELQAIFVERSGLPVDFVPVEEGPDALRSLAEVPQHIIDTLNEYIETGHQ